MNRDKTAEEVSKTSEQQVPVLESVDIQKTEKSAQQSYSNEHPGETDPLAGAIIARKPWE